ncbi:30S ribosome-binding factor RbfA [Columbia Basin potato purple top phytoplasma]|uniref:Ribosome-binding factor A n=1 Tax=Columbia Basin potato purple top phytoplasma TaxID=307134 RepID=A0ABT5L8T8_9MOLU|nr:30S ribosome-binding factor RbfA [Columbia Basin potato purple top phytoplasma]MDC9032039.1 30S ribosome-binding factor RbfA [Columbia Basin potato purple top phytoplasma]
MNNMVIKRRANVIHKLLVDIINDVIKNDSLGYISLTGVDLSNDLSFCNVFYTILNDKSEFLDLAQKLLEENKKEIRLKLASQIRDIKKIPDLIFKYDESLTYGKKIDKLLDNIKK